MFILVLQVLMRINLLWAMTSIKGPEGIYSPTKVIRPVHLQFKRCQVYFIVNNFSQKNSNKRVFKANGVDLIRCHVCSI